MTDAVDVMVSKQATTWRAELDRKQDALALQRRAIENTESEISVLKGKLADLAGIAPIPPDTPLPEVSDMTQALRDRPQRVFP